MAYNGWSNYETWVVKVWMDNDEGSYNYWSHRAREVQEYSNATVTLMDELKDEHEQALPELQGFAADLLNTAFGQVNWHEIAESLIEDFPTEKAEE